MKTIISLFGQSKLTKTEKQLPNLCKLLILTVYLVLVGCSPSKYISKTNLPASGGNYIFHGSKTNYPMVTNATVSDGVISGKVDFSNRKDQGDKKYNVYVYNDSLIHVDSESISVPVQNVKKVSIIMDPYKVLRKKYDYRTYSFRPGDPYNPGTAGFASLIICGLGQGMTGEGGRGLLFFTGYCGLFCASMVPFGKYANSHEGEDVKSLRIFEALFLGAIGIDIWSVIDAARIAKVKNLFFRGQGNTSYNLSIKPFLYTNVAGIKHNFPVGLSVSVTF
jgi:hypothetical protein